MKIVVTQPNFLPWMGYFHQLFMADVFVVLDSVQFARREWQNRNRIIDRRGKTKYITIPVAKSSQKTLIRDVRVSQDFNYSDFSATVNDAYHNSPRKTSVQSILKDTVGSFDYSNGNTLLRDVSLRFLSRIVDEADYSGQIILSSRLNLGRDGATPTDRLLQICKICGASQYLSSIGSRDYMLPELHKFNDSGVKVLWQQFEHVNYVSGCPPLSFVSHLSVIDFLHYFSAGALREYAFNCGRFIGEDEMEVADS